MPISFPSSPTSGQRYEYSFNAWIYNGTFWRATNASGSITSGQLGDNVIFSGNIASGQIGTFHLASGVGGGGGGACLFISQELRRALAAFSGVPGDPTRRGRVRLCPPFSSQSVSQPVSQSVSQLANQPVSLPACQPASQSVSRSVR